MQTLTRSILENTAFTPLPMRLEGGFSPALATGLSAVHRAQLAAALHLKTKRPLAVICPDDTAAEAMAADLGAFLDKSVPVLVGRELEFYGAEAVSRQTEQRRLAALDALESGGTDVVAVSLPGLLQRAIPPEKLSCAAFTLRRGQTLAIEDAEDRLVRAGYEACDKVEGAGQIARRGGILDLFSPSEREPVRMEFWGDEIDQMAFFDPASQRRGQSTECLRVVPAAETIAISSTARPLADSQPKKAAPHLMPPKRSCCASTASRAAPLLARAPVPVARVSPVDTAPAVGDAPVGCGESDVAWLPVMVPPEDGW